MDYTEFEMPSFAEFSKELAYRTPIYVHPARKINYITKNLCYTDIINNQKKNTQKKCRRKTVINKLEETYWSNWKPSKENQDVFEEYNDKKHTHSSKKCHGDTSESIVEHFTSNNFQNSTTSTDYFVKKRVSKQKQSIDVQTELSSIALTKLEEKSKSIENLASPETVKEDAAQKKKTRDETSEKKDPVKSDNEDFWNVIEEETMNLRSTYSSVSIKHTDSLIILKKKQNESKEKVQQPKCIRLFKKLKTGSVNLSRSYMRGGSYPLSSCQGSGKTSLVLSNNKNKAKKSSFEDVAVSGHTDGRLPISGVLHRFVGDVGRPVSSSHQQKTDNSPPWSPV
ncbi:unnamed protein product [Brassicogethes aeneus]|uniref:Uncharacterized protein n=1 Tax=Brassicogethes aeneus TaxID=1431903 RepID=A0A9P0BBU7_BRAAE|nr:unnamed protein product [Brassicogethes aeneus]